MKDIKKYLTENREQMLGVLSKLISYPSVEITDDEKYPFGEPAARCLDYALSVCDEYGMKTKNLDYYAGFGEIGSGKEVIGVVGHLDVVPAGNGWSTDPFTAVIKDDKVYGRGTSDDKGPMVAALFAFKYLIDNKVELNKRLRLVFGCNEESGSRCLKYYVEKEGDFDLGFTPDGPFPCCFGEKGIIHLSLETENKIFESIDAGVAINSVPDTCKFTVKKGLLDINKLEDYLKSSKAKSYTIAEDGDLIKVVVNGKAAHGSTPENGINAAALALSAVANSNVNDKALEEFFKKINTNVNGQDCGVYLKDEYGQLTFNLGLVKLIDNKLTLGIDIRCPFTHENEEVIDKMDKNFDNWKMKVHGNSKGIYQPVDSPFVKLLTDTYNEVTNRNDKPVSMGGGTYARGIKNTLAFGPDSGRDTHMHDADEFVVIEELLQASEIYIKALLKMLEL